jgi:hypothetical protein
MANRATARPVVTAPPVVSPDPKKIASLAELCVWSLRRRGLSDSEILARFTVPDAAADRFYEKQQEIADGCIYAPPLDVKLAMRRLVLATPASTTDPKPLSWDAIEASFAS